MRYTGIDFTGKEVSGHILVHDDHGGTWIREETGYGYTETRIDPDTLEETEE